MGCFNKVGFYSHLPITYGDKIVFFVCISYKLFGREDTPIAPFGILSPLCLPIFGEYDDYGSIENITRDDNVEYIENLFGIDIDSIVKSITMCSGYTLDDVINDERFNRSDNKIYKENVIKIMTVLQEKCLSRYQNVSKTVYLTTTMELADVYDFASNKYHNEMSEQKLNDIVSFISEQGIDHVNVFDRYCYSIDTDLLNALHENMPNSDKLNELLEKNKKYHKLSELIADYCNYNCFNHCAFFSLCIYNNENFKVKQNVELINKFSSFCLCLIMTCVNFTISAYGNQGILEECDKLIDLHTEFIKILKEKKKNYE